MTTHHLYVWPHHDIVTLDDLLSRVDMPGAIAKPVYLYGDLGGPLSEYVCGWSYIKDPTAYFLIKGLSDADEIILRMKGEKLFTCNKDVEYLCGMYSIDPEIIKSAKCCRDEFAPAWVLI